MSDKLVKFIWLESADKLPGRLDIDAVYYIESEGVKYLNAVNKLFKISNPACTFLAFGRKV